MNHALALDMDLAQVRRDWGWMVLFGFLLIALGGLGVAWSVVTTIAGIAFFGALLLVSGLLETGSAIGHYRSQHFWLHLFGGVLDLVIGAFILMRPLEGAVVLTLFLAVFLFVGGLFRVVGAIALRLPGSGWAFASGVVSIVLAAMLYRGWPVTGLWFIGLCIGIALIFRGWALIMLGLLAHRAPEPKPQDSPIV